MKNEKPYFSRRGLNLMWNSIRSRALNLEYEKAKDHLKTKLEGCLTVHLPHEIMWNANLMQQGNFIDIFFARHVSGIYAHHQEH